MSAQLPVIADLLAMVKRGFMWSGELQTSALARLTVPQGGSDRKLDASLAFATEHGYPRVRGHVQGEVEMTCQRCMQPVTVAVDQAFCLGLVQSQAQEERLPDDWDAWYINDTETRLQDILEEELLLALPLVARHEDVNCAGEPEESGTDAEQTQEQKRPNPFEVLAQLKQSR